MTSSDGDGSIAGAVSSDGGEGLCSPEGDTREGGLGGRSSSAGGLSVPVEAKGGDGPGEGDCWMGLVMVVGEGLGFGFMEGSKGPVTTGLLPVSVVALPLPLLGRGEDGPEGDEADPPPLPPPFVGIVLVDCIGPGSGKLATESAGNNTLSMTNTLVEQIFSSLITLAVFPGLSDVKMVSGPVALTPITS